MANFQVNIGLSTSTINELQNSNFHLYGFKAVQTTQGGGAPLVWFKSNNFGPNVKVEWETKYQAYVSQSDIIPNGQITASGKTDIDLGQTWEVNQTGSGPVLNSGANKSISIHNQDPRRWTTGISEKVNGTTNPMCAFPLYGKGLDVIAPITKILLMFATDQVNTGTVIAKAFSTSLLIDLTSDHTRNVGFDIDLGWEWGNNNWAYQYQANANLAPLLIESPAFSPSKEMEGSALVF